MEDMISKTIAVFSGSFTLPGFAETLPAGEYEIETELASPPDRRDPAVWKASVLIKLHDRLSHPGVTRTLTASLAELDHARAKDKLTGRTLSVHFLEEVLADPMVRLVIKADGVSEAQLRHLYNGFETPSPNLNASAMEAIALTAQDEAQIRTAENEGMPFRQGSRSPLRARIAAGLS